MSKRGTYVLAFGVRQCGMGDYERSSKYYADAAAAFDKRYKDQTVIFREWSRAAQTFTRSTSRRLRSITECG